LSSDGNEAAVFQIASRYDEKSTAVQLQYIAIEDWAQAGLTKKSYIDIGRIIYLPITSVNSTPIGRLSENDIRNLLIAMNS
jgi:hypothetical protein